MTDKSARNLRRKQYRRPVRLDLARTESLHSSPCRRLANLLRRFQVCNVSRGAVPVITLHLAIRLTDNNATDAVAGLRVTCEKSVRVAIGPNTTV